MGKHQAQVSRTCSMAWQAYPSRDCSLWNALQKKIFPNGNMVYGRSHTKTVTPSKDLHPVEEEWERRSSRENPLPHHTMPVVSLKGLGLKSTSSKVKGEEPGLKLSLGKAKERWFCKHVLVSFFAFFSQ